MTEIGARIMPYPAPQEHPADKEGSPTVSVFCTPGVDYICRQVQRQLLRNESARFYHHRTRKCIPPRKLRREIQ
jgi:hypothetical protein